MKFKGVGLFVLGALFGLEGIKLLTSKDAKKLYETYPFQLPDYRIFQHCAYSFWSGRDPAAGYIGTAS